MRQSVFSIYSNNSLYQPRHEGLNTMHIEDLCQGLVAQGAIIESEGSTMMVVHNNHLIGHLSGKEATGELVLARPAKFFDSERAVFDTFMIDSMTFGKGSVSIGLCNGETYSARDFPMTDTNYSIIEEFDPKMVWRLNRLIKITPFIFPHHKEQFWIDDLQDMEMIDMEALGQPKEIRMFGPVELVAFIEYIQNWVETQGYVNVPSDRVIEQYFTVLVNSTHRNEFYESFKDVEWDGVPRARTWFIDTFGAAAPGIREHPEFTPDDERRYLEEVSARWFVGGIARTINKSGAKHEIVPVLIGPQGCGKSASLCYTGFGHITDPKFYIETTVSADDPMNLLNSISGAVIVELAESTQFKTSSNNNLKAFISKFTDTYRAPYDKKPSTHPRRFILAATSNDDELFTDSTGSRRFYPMVCSKERRIRRFEDGDLHEVEQVWAEALVMYHQGHPYVSDDELDELARFVQSTHTVVPLVVTLINDILDEDPRTRTIGSMFTLKELISIIQGYSVPGIASDQVMSALKSWKRYSKDSWAYKDARRPSDGLHTKFFVRTSLPEVE